MIWTRIIFEINIPLISLLSLKIRDFIIFEKFFKNLRCCTHLIQAYYCKSLYMLILCGSLFDDNIVLLYNYCARGDLHWVLFLPPLQYYKHKHGHHWNLLPPFCRLCPKPIYSMLYQNQLKYLQMVLRYLHSNFIN